MNYYYIIVEDNIGAQKNLQIELKKFPDFKEIGVANTLKRGINLALSLKPHLIFLDVQLGKDNGFELIKEIRQYNTDLPFVIMTTDFEQHAKKAVNSSVLHFLDKPIDYDELSLALDRFKKELLKITKHIVLKDSKGHFFTRLKDIIYIKANNNYCLIYLKDGTSLNVSKTLKQMEAQLPFPFMRVHKSCIINTKFIKMLNTNKKTIVLSYTVQDEVKCLDVDISNTYMTAIKHQLLLMPMENHR